MRLEAKLFICALMFGVGVTIILLGWPELTADRRTLVKFGGAALAAAGIAAGAVAVARDKGGWR